MKNYLITLLFSLIIASMAAAQGYMPGDKALDFKLKNIDEKQVSMADYTKAKGFIVIFTCNHCPFSVAYEDRINELDRKFKPFGYPVIAINPNDPELQPEDSFEEMQSRAAQKEFTFPYLLDEGQHVYPEYGANRTPHVFLLEAVEGDYIVKYVGAIDDNHQDETAVKEKYVENAVNALIKGQKPELDFTKAIGCSIKQKE